MAKTPLGYGSQNRRHSSHHSKVMAICRALAALGASGGVRAGETIFGSAKAPLWAFQGHSASEHVPVVRVAGVDLDLVEKDVEPGPGL
jgi:hypothetical protein